MKQIEKEMAQAFAACKNFHKSNIVVETNATIWDYSAKAWRKFAAVVYLHGNLIAAKDADGVIYYSNAGWNTTTTRSRLSALGAPVRIKDFILIRTDTGAAFPSTLTRLI